MAKVRIAIEDIEHYMRLRQLADTTTLDNIEFTREGVAIPVDPSLFIDWEETGLTNLSFAECHLLPADLAAELVEKKT